MKITLFLIFLVTLEIILSGCTKNPVIPTPNDDPYPMFVDRDFSKVELNRTRIVNISHFPKSDLENTIDLENISGIIYQSIFNASKNKPWTLAIDDLSQKKRLFLYQGKRKIQSISGDDNGTSLLVSMVGESTIKAQTQVFRIDLANNSLTLLYENDAHVQTVTMAAKGDIMAWEEIQHDGIYTVVYTYSSLGISNILKIKDAGQPHISNDGTNLIYTKKTNNTVSILSYSLAEKKETQVYSSRFPISSLSISEDSNTIAWLEKTDTEYQIKLHNRLTDLTYTLTSYTSELADPYITPDAKWLIYNKKIDQLWQVRFRNLVTIQDVALTSSETVNYRHFAWQTPVTTCSKSPAPKPNFIMILTDDQPYSTMQYMPYTLKHLSQEGTTFTNAYLSTPLCCPARASILRGQFTHNHGVVTNDPPHGGFPKFYELGLENSTLATWLQNQDYKTALVGKYLNRFPGMDTQSAIVPESYIPPGWSEFYTPLYTIPFFHPRMSLNGEFWRYADTPDFYTPDIIKNISVDFTQRHGCEDKPFFLFIAPPTPHTPATPAPRHANMFNNLKVPRTPSYNESDISDKPIFFRDNPALTEQQIADLDALYRDQVRSLQTIDEMIHELVISLEETGELDNTYIVYLSDNGFYMGDHRLINSRPSPEDGSPMIIRYGKNMPYDIISKTPFLIRGPNIPKGVQNDALIYNIDIAPTFTSLAGAETPDFVDGKSLEPLFQNPNDPNWRNAILIEDYAVDNKSQTVFTIALALRTQQYKYTEWSFWSGDVYDPPELEVYDLINDPYEINNLASSVNPDLIATLKSQLDSLKDCQSQSCP